MNTPKIFFSFALLLMIVPFVLFSSGQQDDAAELEQAASIRVVSLAPNITEVIFALGKGSTLIGRTEWCNYPPEAADVATVGSIQQPSVETIIELNPDIVIASTHAPKEAGEQLMSAGLDVRYYYGPESFEGVYDVIKAVGADLDAVAEAETLVDEISSRYTKLKIDAATITERPSVYYAIGFGDGGDWTAGGDTFVGQLIDVAGGDNIAADVSGWSYSLEKIVEEQPEIILVGEGQKEAFLSSPFYSELNAVKNGRLYGINEDKISRQGPRLIEGIEQLNAIFSE